MIFAVYYVLIFLANTFFGDAFLKVLWGQKLFLASTLYPVVLTFNLASEVVWTTNTYYPKVVFDAKAKQK